MRAEFIDRAERVIDAVAESDPETAMWAGDHRFDDRLPDYSADAVARQVSMLDEASHALVELDVDELDTPETVDAEILVNDLAARRFALTELREHEWNPLVYNPGMLLNTLLLRPTAPAADRLAALRARLSAVGDHLATARANLTEVPAIFAETAARQFRGTAALVRDEAPKLAAEAEASLDVTAAARALDEFADWLTTLPDGRSPRLGRRLWEARLWHALQTPMSGKAILEQAWQRLDRVGAELDELAVRLEREASPSQSARRELVRGGGGGLTAHVLSRLAADRPDDHTVLDAAKRAVDESVRFVREHDLVTIPDDRLEIVTMPEHDRGVSIAYLDPPGTLDAADIPTYFGISPAPGDWSAERVDSFYREYNHHMVRNLAVHEAIPGHHLQLAHSRRFRGSTRTREVMFCLSFVEGWAVYAEELMADRGFGGDALRAQQLKMQLRMTINAILDQLIHCEDMSEAEAMELMTRRGHQTEAEAAGKWRRAQLSSAQLSTYFVGYTEVRAIVDRRPDRVSERDWHDRMLSHGKPAPRHVSTLLGL